MAEKTKDQLKADYRKGALALNVIAAKLNALGENPPEVPSFKPFKGTPEQRKKILESLKGKTVNNTGWTTILGVCGITGTAPVLAARDSLLAAEEIQMKEVAGVGRNTGKLICLAGEDMANMPDVISYADVAK